MGRSNISDSAHRQEQTSAFCDWISKEARDASNELEAHVNRTLEAKCDRAYPEIRVGGQVYIYLKRMQTQKSHISVWSAIAYEVEEISQSHGTTGYSNNCQRQVFFRHEIQNVFMM